MTNLTEQKKSTFNLLDVLNFDSSKIEENEELERKIKAESEFEEYKKSGVPDKFFNESFETFKAETDEEKTNLSKTMCFADNPHNRVLILCGNNGCGKTMLACSIIRKCGGRYIDSRDLCVEYESSSDFNSKKTKSQVLKTYSKCKLLVIDECCKYTLRPENERFILSYIVCMRYENDLPTVLVTNSNKKEFVEFLGKAVFDRLTESCTTLEFTQESRRRSLRNVG